MTLEEAFGIVLKKRRSMLDISQEELAFRCDLDRSYISLLERGMTSPTLTSLALISAQVGVKVSTLVREAEGLRQDYEGE